MMKGNIIYFSHGGGPLPLLNDKTHETMFDFLQLLSKKINIPKNIIVISAHWEESKPTILSSNNPKLLYDYFGFPDAAYNIKFPFTGNKQLVTSIVNKFKIKGIELIIDTDRGIDHGVFVPLKIMYPESVMSITQISLVKGLDPKYHIEIGNILNEIIDDDTLVIGSGFSFHNMNAFDWDGLNLKDEKNDSFQNWLIDICCGDYTKDQTEKLLIDWRNAPYADYCHPREEHLIPLHFCFGASKDRGEIIFDDYILGKRSIAIKW